MRFGLPSTRRRHAQNQGPLWWDSFAALHCQVLICFAEGAHSMADYPTLSSFWCKHHLLLGRANAFVLLQRYSETHLLIESQDLDMGLFAYLEFCGRRTASKDLYSNSFPETPYLHLNCDSRQQVTINGFEVIHLNWVVLSAATP